MEYVKCNTCLKHYPLSDYKYHMKRGKKYRNPKCKHCIRVVNGYAKKPTHRQLELIKKCCHCQEELPYTDYKYKFPKKNILYSMCRACFNIYIRDEYVAKGKHKDSKYKRRALEKEIGKIPDTFYAIDNGFCSYCGTYEGIGKLTIDHFIPLSLGGDNSIHNLVWCCNKCNCGKRDKDFYTWYKWYSK